MQVFVGTNEFNKDPKYASQSTFGIEPTMDTLMLIKDALRAGRRFWRPGYRHAKAGIVPIDLQPSEKMPETLFPSVDLERSARLIGAMDVVNQR